MSASSTTPAPGSTASLHQANRARVVDMLRSAGPGQTQADIARATGLASATVSNIVRELTTAGVVETKTGTGRRGNRVRLARAAGIVAGIDFGHAHVAVAVGDLSGKLLGEARLPLAADHAYAEGLDRAMSLLSQVLGELELDIAGLRSVAVGLPAPLSNGVVDASGILPGWAGIAPQELIADRIGAPTYIDNDANLGALAEHRVGVATGIENIVFVKVSSGVGAGLIIRGEILRGANGSTGEIGHLTLDEQGPVCRCGSRGCLEAYAASGAVLALVEAQFPGATIDEVIAAAQGGNLAATRVIEDAGVHLGWGIAAAVNLLGPGMVVIGGEMARAGEIFLNGASRGMRRHALELAAAPIVASELGERASLVGAVIYASDQADLLADLA